MSETDTALVVRARAGDRAAFEELVRRTSRLVFARLYLDSGRVDRVEDLLTGNVPARVPLAPHAHRRGRVPPLAPGHRPQRPDRRRPARGPAKAHRPDGRHAPVAVAVARAVAGRGRRARRNCASGCSACCGRCRRSTRCRSRSGTSPGPTTRASANNSG